MSGLGDKPAFPGIRIEQRGDPAYNQPTRIYFPGVTYRQLAALHVMAGAAADPSAVDDEKVLASWAVKAADALIAALEAPPVASDAAGPNRAANAPIYLEAPTSSPGGGR